MANTAARNSSEDVLSQTRPSSCRTSADRGRHAEPAQQAADAAGSEIPGSRAFVEEKKELKSSSSDSQDAERQVKKSDIHEGLHNATENDLRFLAPELTALRRAYLLLIARAVMLTIIIMWICLPVYWGALASSAKLTENLDAWFIDRDQSRIGHALWDGFNNSLAQPGLHLGWELIDASTAGSNEQIIDAILQDQAWVAVVVEADATLRLSDARANGNTSYNPNSAITVYYSQSRQEIATGNYVLPITTQLLQATTTAWATSAAQRYFAQITPNGVVNTTAIRMLATAPQTIAPAIGWTVVNLRPYAKPAVQAVTLVGNIFLCIFAFMITMANSTARGVIASRLKLSSYLAVRIVVPLLAYLPLSLSYNLISLAFDLPFNAKYTQGGGFMLAFIYVYMGMAALGLALEAMVTVLTPKFIPFFLFILILYNISPVVLPEELQVSLYGYGRGFPIWNLSQAMRTILLNTQSHLSLNAAVLISWILLSCATLTLFTWLLRCNQKRGLSRTGLSSDSSYTETKTI